MLNIFKYKKMYFNVCNDLANISLKFDSAKSEIQSLKKQLEQQKQRFECHRKKNKEKYLWLLDTSNKKIQYKEHLRRKNAGKIGALQKKINYFEAEHQEMMKIINNLISENQKLKHQKKKPTLNELRSYFKKY